MQPHHFSYDELTPLEQCIADFMAVQERRSESRKKNPQRKSANPHKRIMSGA